MLSDGTVFCGQSFGYEAEVEGEVVFNTAMTGYPESLTDPSYAGQILTFTYPLIGNYGVPEAQPHPLTPSPKGKGEAFGNEVSNTIANLPRFMESGRIHVKAVIVADYSEEYSHWNAKESLAAWLKREKIPGITGIDTRRLTQVLREHGVMMGEIRFTLDPSLYGGEKKALPTEGEQGEGHDYGSVNWVEKVSCKEVITYKPDIVEHGMQLSNCQMKVVLVDCGVKANIIRCLLRRGVEVIRVPWDYDFNQLEFDGLFLANGPGDPEQCGKTVEHIRTFLNNK